MPLLTEEQWLQESNRDLEEYLKRRRRELKKLRLKPLPAPNQVANGESIGGKQGEGEDLTTGFNPPTTPASVADVQEVEAATVAAGPAVLEDRRALTDLLETTESVKAGETVLSKDVSSTVATAVNEDEALDKETLELPVSVGDGSKAVQRSHTSTREPSPELSQSAMITDSKHAPDEQPLQAQPRPRSRSSSASSAEVPLAALKAAVVSSPPRKKRKLSVTTAEERGSAKKTVAKAKAKVVAPVEEPIRNKRTSQLDPVPSRSTKQKPAEGPPAPSSSKYAGLPRIGRKVVEESRSSTPSVPSAAPTPLATMPFTGPTVIPNFAPAPAPWVSSTNNAGSRTSSPQPPRAVVRAGPSSLAPAPVLVPYGHADRPIIIDEDVDDVPSPSQREPLFLDVSDRSPVVSSFKSLLPANPTPPVPPPAGTQRPKYKQHSMIKMVDVYGDPDHDKSLRVNPTSAPHLPPTPYLPPTPHLPLTPIEKPVERAPAPITHKLPRKPKPVERPVMRFVPLDSSLPESRQSPAFNNARHHNQPEVHNQTQSFKRTPVFAHSPIPARREEHTVAPGLQVVQPTPNAVYQPRQQPSAVMPQPMAPPVTHVPIPVDPRR